MANKGKIMNTDSSGTEGVAELGLIMIVGVGVIGFNVG
jgi:hypothetical protein